MVKNPLPFDPRPSKAHPEHRQKRRELEANHPAFNSKDAYIKAGLMALMAGIALFPWEKKHQEHDHRIREEERYRRRSKEGGERRRRRRSYGDFEDRGYGRDDRRKSMGDWERAGREEAGYYADGHYDDRRSRRRRDKEDYEYVDGYSHAGGSERSGSSRVKRDADGQRRSKDGGRHPDDLKHELI